MKDRGKAVETYISFPDSNSEIPCSEHPYSSHVGICPHCLKDRLLKLACSECGKRRISSCSCSDSSSSSSSSNRNSFSFLINYEKSDRQKRNYDESDSEKVYFLRRSRSTCVEVQKRNGFWSIRRLFRRKTNSDRGENVDDVVVSRSRSLRSFKGGRNADFSEGSEFTMSNAKISDVSSGILFDSDKRLGFSSAEIGNRVCSAPNRSVFPVRGSDFGGADDSAFIDLKLDSYCGSKKDLCSGRNSAVADGDYICRNESFEIGGNGGGCCRNERGLKQGRRNYKIWKWIFK